MAKYSEEERYRILCNLRASISVVPIELQLMYLYTLIISLFARKEDNVYYTSIVAALEIIPQSYEATISKLRKYRNTFAHEGFVACRSYFEHIVANKFEVDTIAQMCDVTLNWNNSLNLF